MSDDRVILLTNRGDGVDEVPNDEEDYEAAGIELNVNIPYATYNKILFPYITKDTPLHKLRPRLRW